MINAKLLSPKDYKSHVKPTWCPGCGDFGLLSAMYKALAELQLQPHEVVVVSGIGCSSRIPYFVNTYGIHGLHGRAIPLAQGVKLGNPELTVFAAGGDGDLFSIGGGHMPHAASRNVDITTILMDNSIYGLTKGQTSPTSPKGRKTKSTPYGAIVRPQNPVLLALTYGASFVARGYTAKPQQLADLIVKGARHKGFSFIHVLSPCVEFNNTFSLLDSVVEDMPESHDVLRLEDATHMALTEEKIHLGVFYRAEKPSFVEEAQQFVPSPTSFNVEEYLKRYE